MVQNFSSLLPLEAYTYLGEGGGGEKMFLESIHRILWSNKLVLKFEPIKFSPKNKATSRIYTYIILWVSKVKSSVKLSVQ